MCAQISDSILWLFQDVKLAKVKFLKELDNLQIERDNLRSREVEDLNSNFKSIIENCAMSPQNSRKLPAILQDRASEVPELTLFDCTALFSFYQYSTKRLITTAR